MKKQYHDTDILFINYFNLTLASLLFLVKHATLLAKLKYSDFWIFMQTSTIDRKYKVADDILFRQVENEAILLHIPSGTYYSLSETSIIFWQSLSNSEPLTSAIDKIVAEYEVERDRILEDLQSFLQDLSTCGLISPVTSVSD